MPQVVEYIEQTLDDIFFDMVNNITLPMISSPTRKCYYDIDHYIIRIDQYGTNTTWSGRWKTIKVKPQEVEI